MRGVQSGFVRSYALLLVTGFAGLGLYFLLQQLMRRPLIQILLWAPLAFGLVGLFLPQRLAGWWAPLGRAGDRSGLAIAVRRRLRLRRGGLQHTVDVSWISGLGVDYSLGDRRAQPLPGPADRGALAGGNGLRRPSASRSGRSSSSS